MCVPERQPVSTECSCGARIDWYVTDLGKRIPLDPEPRPDGNITVKGRLAHVLRAGEVPSADQARYVSHFATCPDADGWRKRRKA